MHFVLKHKYRGPSLVQAPTEAEEGDPITNTSPIWTRVSSGVSSPGNLRKDFSQNKRGLGYYNSVVRALTACKGPYFNFQSEGGSGSSLNVFIFLN